MTVIHALAYLSNALAPIWNLLPFDGKLLKRQRGPYYPALQWDLERLVAQGLVRVSGLRYVKDASRWRIDADYSLNMKFAHSVLVTAERVGFELDLKSLYRE